MLGWYALFFELLPLWVCAALHVGVRGVLFSRWVRGLCAAFLGVVFCVTDVCVVVRIFSCVGVYCFGFLVFCGFSGVGAYFLVWVCIV